ncbi:MAG: hypothetical protein WA890_28500 [Micromonospora sp.]
MAVPEANEAARGFGAHAVDWAGRGLWLATATLGLGLLLNAALSLYELTHPGAFYAGSPNSMSGSFAYLLAQVAGYAQVLLTPLVVAVLLWGTARVNGGSAGWRVVLGLICGALVLSCANWFRTKPREDRTGPELGWVHDQASASWAQFIDLVAPPLVL